MKNYAIKVKGVTKTYNIKSASSGAYNTLRDTISEKLKKIRTFERDKKSESFNALNNLNFQINPGDKVAIIGHNGAGKSTLLKVLSRITKPTKGEVHIHGRVTSLLEVGTGFHPELSGRENIYLNGSILGMTKKEIKSRFDEIVEFSGIGKFLDTPVKRYSSGMRMRLGFAVAAHLESEILIIDEVLAVGDAEFQKKCIGKMDEISKTGGRTILFVSHQMSAVKQLCNRGIVLNKGRVEFDGDIDKSIILYKKAISESTGRIKTKHESIDVISIKNSGIINSKDDMNLLVEIQSKEDFSNCIIDYGIYNEKFSPINHYQSAPIGRFYDIKTGYNKININISKTNLNSGEYQFGIYISKKNGEVLLDMLELSAGYIDSADPYTSNSALMSFDTDLEVHYNE